MQKPFPLLTRNAANVVGLGTIIVSLKAIACRVTYLILALGVVQTVAKLFHDSGRCPISCDVIVNKDVCKTAAMQVLLYLLLFGCNFDVQL